MNENREWVLGCDVSVYDNLLDPITFEDLIMQIQCNCSYIKESTVRQEVKEILENRIEDFKFLLEKNMDEIIRLAKEGRE